MTDTVGIRALKQNASEIVRRAERGETLTITDRGRPVARLVPIVRTTLQQLVESGAARPPTRSIADLPAPPPGPSVSAALEAMRSEDDR
jgi:prevent-host-death family protein